MRNFLKKLGFAPNPFKNKPIFAGYYLLETIGRGSFGAVHKALKIDEADSGHFVAIKMLHETQNEQHKMRFQREVATLFNLSHPNVVKVLEYGEENDVCYFTMEILEGSDLEMLLREGLLARERIVSTIKQVASGLQATHDQGVVHRDVKPGNIFVCKDGTVKVIDFGLAKDPQATVKVTLQGEGAAGTLPYMPPDVEPVLSGLDFKLTPAYDQFSLATVAYEMLTGGKRPFYYPVKRTRGPDMSSILFSALNSVGDIPHSKEVDAVLHKAMDRDPNKRYRTVLEFAEALEKIFVSKF